MKEEKVGDYIVLSQTLILFKDFFLFLERVRKGEREGEKHQCMVASQAPPTGDLAYNPSMSPTRNRTSDHLAHIPVLNPLSHTSWACFLRFLNIKLNIKTQSQNFHPIKLKKMSPQILTTPGKLV